MVGGTLPRPEPEDEDMAKRKQKQQTTEAPLTLEQVVVPVSEPEAPATEPKPKKRGLAATMAKYRPGYVDGKSCGDAIAQRLAGMSLEAVIAEAERISNLEPGALVTKYASLNLGQQRMCAGNRIRAASKKAQKAVDAEIAALIPKE